MKGQRSSRACREGSSLCYNRYMLADRLERDELLDQVLEDERASALQYWREGQSYDRPTNAIPSYQHLEL